MTDRAAPYPADTRAKGWRFELDYEKIEQSGTWAAAMTAALDGLPLARPFLLAMWYAAWKQVPCGSLPPDERELAGAIGIPSSVFAEYRDLLMRGWWLADDGRLYHDTVTQRVLEMIEYRRKNAKRVADFKAAQREQRGGNALPTGEDSDSNDTGTGTGTTQQDKPVVKRGKRAATAPPVAIERPAEVPESVWNDWHAVRKVKRAGPVTETAWEGLLREATRAGLQPADAVRACCEFGWQGFNAGWYAERIAKRGASVVPLRQQAIEEHNRQVGDAWLAEQERRDAAG